MTLEEYFGIKYPVTGTIVHVDFPRRKMLDAYRLYRVAAQLDEDPRNFSEAANMYKQALRLDPQMDPCWTNLGNIMFRLNMMDRADECYKKALSINPLQSEANFNLGIMSYNNEEFGKAEKFFENAINADPGHADTHFYLGYTLVELEQRLRARLHLATFLQLDPFHDLASNAKELLTRLDRA